MKPVIIGDATLYCADCMDILPMLETVDAVITDPPYGVGFTGTTTKHHVKDRIGYASFDDTPENIRDEIIPRLCEAMKLARRTVFTPGTKCAHLYPRPDGEGVIWYPSGANTGPWGFITHQPIYYYGKCPYLATGRGSRPTGFSSTETAEKNGHPCPKPIGVMRWLVNRISNPCEIILDPFMGSGTTGVASIQLGRKFIGIEKDPKYFDIACQRIDKEVAQGKLFEPEPMKQVQESLL